MAEKAEKKPETAAPAGGGEKKAAAAGGGLLAKTPILIGGAMIIEAVILFAGFKFLGGGATKRADAALAGISENKEGGAPAENDPKRTVEIPVADFRAINRRNGHTFLYDVSVVAIAKFQNAETVKKIVAERVNLIRDRISTIIAESDPEKLNGGTEPGRETLKRQVKYQLDILVGEGLIEEVVVPKCIPFRADY
jgi:flagellar basal body-associated protein FliL